MFCFIYIHRFTNLILFRIVELDSGNHHIAIITSTGRLLTLATDPEGTQFGQLGVKSGEVYQFYEPEFLDKTLKFEKLAIGGNHTIVASSSHRLFGFGMNDLGVSFVCINLVYTY
jgi:alpha-tubulin suppressor-like RCC1 family protein